MIHLGWDGHAIESDGRGWILVCFEVSLFIVLVCFWWWLVVLILLCLIRLLQLPNRNGTIEKSEEENEVTINYKTFYHILYSNSKAK